MKDQGNPYMDVLNQGNEQAQKIIQQLQSTFQNGGLTNLNSSIDLSSQNNPFRSENTNTNKNAPDRKITNLDLSVIDNSSDISRINPLSDYMLDKGSDFGVQSIQNIQKKNIQQSELNNIFSFEQFEKIQQYCKAKTIIRAKKTLENMISQGDDINQYKAIINNIKISEVPIWEFLLNDMTRLSLIMYKTKKIQELPKLNKIRDILFDLLISIISLNSIDQFSEDSVDNINNTDVVKEMTDNLNILLYSLIASFEKQNQNKQEVNFSILEQYYFLLIPISLKQTQLLTVKFFEIWFELNFKIIHIVQLMEKDPLYNTLTEQ